MKAVATERSVMETSSSRGLAGRLETLARAVGGGV